MPSNTLAQVKLFSGVLLYMCVLYVYIAAFVPFVCCATDPEDELLSSTSTECRTKSQLFLDRPNGGLYACSCILNLMTIGCNMLCARQSQSEALFFIGVDGHSEILWTVSVYLLCLYFVFMCFKLCIPSQQGPNEAINQFSLV